MRCFSGNRIDSFIVLIAQKQHLHLPNVLDFLPNCLINMVVAFEMCILACLRASFLLRTSEILIILTARSLPPNCYFTLCSSRISSFQRLEWSKNWLTKSSVKSWTTILLSPQVSKMLKTIFWRSHSFCKKIELWKKNLHNTVVG